MAISHSTYIRTPRSSATAAALPDSPLTDPALPQSTRDALVDAETLRRAILYNDVKDAFSPSDIWAAQELTECRTFGFAADCSSGDDAAVFLFAVWAARAAFRVAPGLRDVPRSYACLTCEVGTGPITDAEAWQQRAEGHDLREIAEVSAPARYVWLGETQVPPPGTHGVAWPAGGFNDPESCEQGAYLFQPDGEERAYYCDPEHDLEPLKEAQHAVSAPAPTPAPLTSEALAGKGGAEDEHPRQDGEPRATGGLAPVAADPRAFVPMSLFAPFMGRSRRRR